MPSITYTQKKVITMSNWNAYQKSISLSDVWPSNISSASVGINGTITNSTQINGKCFEAYFSSSGSSNNASRYAGLAFDRGQTHNFNWGSKSVSGSSNSKFWFNLNTAEGYRNTNFNGTFYLIITWTESITGVTAGNPIYKTDFDRIGWTATVGSPISHSGYSGVIYASTYNGLSLSKSKTDVTLTV